MSGRLIMRWMRNLGLPVVAGLLITSQNIAHGAEGDLPYRTSGFYLGIGAGMANQSLDQNVVDISGTSFAWKATGGYRFPSGFMPWDSQLGLETSYVALGEVDDDVVGNNVAMQTSGIR